MQLASFKGSPLTCVCFQLTVTELCAADYGVEIRCQLCECRGLTGHAGSLECIARVTGGRRYFSLPRVIWMS